MGWRRGQNKYGAGDFLADGRWHIWHRRAWHLSWHDRQAITVILLSFFLSSSPSSSSLLSLRSGLYCGLVTRPRVRYFLCFQFLRFLVPRQWEVTKARHNRQRTIDNSNCQCLSFININTFVFFHYPFALPREFLFIFNIRPRIYNLCLGNT